MPQDGAPYTEREGDGHARRRPLRSRLDRRACIGRRRLLEHRHGGDAPALDHRGHLAERAPRRGRQGLGAQPRIGHRSLQRLPVELPLVGDRHRRAVDLIRAGVDGGVDDAPGAIDVDRHGNDVRGREPHLVAVLTEHLRQRHRLRPHVATTRGLDGGDHLLHLACVGRQGRLAVAARESTPSERTAVVGTASHRAVARDGDRVSGLGGPVDRVRALRASDAGDAAATRSREAASAMRFMAFLRRLVMVSSFLRRRAALTSHGQNVLPAAPLASALRGRPGEAQTRPARRWAGQDGTEACGSEPQARPRPSRLHEPRSRLCECLAHPARAGSAPRGDALRRRAGRDERAVTDARRDRSCASRNGTPSRTSASAASVASTSGSEAARAIRSRSTSRPATSAVRARSPRRVSARAAKTGALSSCRSRSYASGRPLTVASSPVSRPIAVPALPRASSATSGLSFCGIIDEPVAAFSGSFAKPNSPDDQRTISSPIRDRCV